MTDWRVYHFVISWEDIDDLKQLLEGVSQEEKTFIDIQVYPPHGDTVEGWNLDTGNFEELPDTATLTFELYAIQQDKAGRVAIPTKMISYGESKEEKCTGMAYPPSLLKGEGKDD